LRYSRELTIKQKDQRMNQFARYSLAALLLLAPGGIQPVNAAEPKVAAGDVARGKYIVESVAMCVTCHSPRNAAGVPDPARLVAGAPILQPAPGWATYAPRLAGTPPETDEELIRLWTTGISRTGSPPRQPMPSFRMTRPDAEAVLAYLKSLGK
jgi:mono/diheme cytochrome c family protein